MSYLTYKDELVNKLVKKHIQSQKPVGSKILAREFKNIFSPATLRIYLRKLTQEGLMENVGICSGKVPTDYGWKYYLQTNISKVRSEIKKDKDFDENADYLINKYKVIFLELGISKKIKGLQTFVRKNMLENDVVEEACYFIENVDNLVNKLLEGLHIYIGKEIPLNSIQKISFLSFKHKNNLLILVSNKRVDYPKIYINFVELIKSIKSNE